MKAKPNSSRIEGIVNKLAGAEKIDDVRWVLKELVKTYTQSLADDYIKANVDGHYNAGLSPKITRICVGKCCEWCEQLAGTYLYQDAPHDIYRRHERCRCLVTYDPGDGSKQNVWSKKVSSLTEEARLENIKFIEAKNAEPRKTQNAEIRAKKTVFEILEDPKRFGNYTPAGLKQILEGGYEVTPMSGGRLKGILFEDGGGYKINFEGDKILLYHPDLLSHHGGEYYKISSGVDGVRRFTINGEKIDG